MSALRSRFKIVANIPARRKNVDVSISAEPNKNPNAVARTQEVGDVIKNEKIDLTTSTDIDGASYKSTKDRISSKCTFKNVKPYMSSVSRSSLKLTQSSEIQVTESDPTVNEIVTDTNTEEGKSHDSQFLVPSEIHQSETPISSDLVPLSPQKTKREFSPHIKSPIRPRFVRPSPFDRHRRTSYQCSSASESEDDPLRLPTVGTPSDENGRISQTSELNQCDSGPQSKGVEGPPSFEINRMLIGVKRRRMRPSNSTRKIAEARRELNRKFEKKKPDRGSLKMFDLIFYNPPTNPMLSDIDKTVKNETILNKKEAISDPEPKEDNDDDPGEEESEESAMPVPQVKIGANGEIILDEKSLVIETTEAKKGRENLLKSVPIFDDGSRKMSYYGKRNSRSKDWTPLETKCFYKALNSIGTDFALMEPLFPDRTRGQLKNKFKREERLNPKLVEIALGHPAEFNVHRMKEEFDNERRLAELEAKKMEAEVMQSLKEKRTRNVRRPSIAKDPLEDEISMPAPTCDYNSLKKLRPVRRASLRRKIAKDFVDPNEIEDIDEGVIEAFKNRHAPKVYSPVIDEDHDSDVDSMVSDCPSELTVPVSNLEFISVVQKNLQNLQQTTIKVGVPRSNTDFGGEDVHVMLEQDGEVIFSPRSSDFKTPRDSIISPANENMEPIHGHAPARNPFESSHDLNERADDTVDMDEPINGNVRNYELDHFMMRDDTSDASTATNQYDIRTLTKPDVSSKDVSRVSETNVYGVSDGYPSESSSIVSLTSNPGAETIMPPNGLPVSNLPMIEAKPASHVKFKNCGNFEYAVVERNRNDPEMRTYLSGLQAGSFVFMATEGSEKPLEQRCSMCMIVEKIDAFGNKSLTPMPVILPPDLMNHIIGELNCT